MNGSGVANAFLGTSEFAAVVLRALAASPHRPSLVVTPPDRPKGRGRRLSPPPVAEAARELGLEVHQTRSVNDPESTATVLDSGVELGTVCAFGQLISEPLLSRLPMLNVHPSLLPRWRGAAPVERALMAGDERTGVCVMRLTEGLDSGPVALRREIAVGEAENYGGLSERLSALGAELLIEALDRHASGELRFEPQKERGATYAEKIELGDRRLDPRRPAPELARVVRALTPHIGAFLELGEGERLGITAAAAVEAPRGCEAGSLLADGDRLLLGCGEGALAIERLQPPGKREMAAADWLRGHEPPSGVSLA